MFAKFAAKVKAATGQGDGLEPENQEFQEATERLAASNGSFVRLNKVGVTQV